jgi:hypothetical protein
MGLLSKFGIGGVTTLLARNIVINENPANGENYLLVEGDEVGFLNWLLKNAQTSAKCKSGKAIKYKL